MNERLQPGDRAVIIKHDRTRKYNRHIRLDIGTEVTVVEPPNEGFPSDAVQVSFSGGSGAVDRFVLKKVADRNHMLDCQKYALEAAFRGGREMAARADDSRSSHLMDCVSAAPVGKFPTEFGKNLAKMMYPERTAINELKEENQHLRELIHSMWVHAGYPDCGYREMTTDQKRLYDEIKKMSEIE